MLNEKTFTAFKALQDAQEECADPRREGWQKPVARDIARHLAQPAWTVTTVTSTVTLSATQTPKAARSPPRGIPLATSAGTAKSLLHGAEQEHNTIRQNCIVILFGAIQTFSVVRCSANHRCLGFLFRVV